MSNYTPIACLRVKLTCPGQGFDITFGHLFGVAVVGRGSVLQVGGLSAPGARFLVRLVPYISVAHSPTKDRISNGPELQSAPIKSHALPLIQPRSMLCACLALVHQCSSA